MKYCEEKKMRIVHVLVLGRRLCKRKKKQLLKNNKNNMNLKIPAKTGPKSRPEWPRLDWKRIGLFRSEKIGDFGSGPILKLCTSLVQATL